MKREEAQKRAAELVGKMTLEEKASQLRFDAPAIERLGIPAYNWWNEALHGVARAGVATVFPQAIGMAAAFDPDMMEEIGDAIAQEGRAKYNAQIAHGDRDIYKGITFWSPNVNIFRDPRWGRGHETYGEDPYLSGRLGVRFIQGLQGDGPVMKAAACAKHFCVHSGPEALRHEFNAIASVKDMEETYLPAFEACVKEGHVESVMGAYNRVNGEPACGSPFLQSILRGKWGFEGHYVSDCWAIRDFHEHHKVTSVPEESVKLALENGTDLNCGCTYTRILEANRLGMLDEAYLTESCIRLFTTRFLLGMFDETLEGEEGDTGNSYAEGEEGDTGNSYASGDKTDLSYPEPQQKLMKTILDYGEESGKPVVIVNMTGSAMDLCEAVDKAAAILQAWYPGARAGADIAGILFGDVSPSGKLPVTFYRNCEELPPFEDYAMKGRTYRYFDKEPLYPFGYGLTYGDCSAQEMSVKIQKAEDFDEDAAFVSVRVDNRGEATEDVLQIYIHDEEYPGAVPNPSLCGFKRVRLEKGESREVTIPIRLRAFTSVDERGKREVRSRKFRIWAGFSQPDQRSEKLTGNAVLTQLVEL